MRDKQASIFRSCRAFVVASLGLAVLGVAGRASAAHFVTVDEQKVQQGPPQPAQLADEAACTSSGDFFGEGVHVDTQSAVVDLGSVVSLAGDCETDDTTFASTEILTVTITADPGDPEGSVPLCFEARHDLAADSTPGFTATATFGSGSTIPITGPAAITRNPGAITIFSDGPTTIHSGTNGDSQSGLTSANIGDTITLSAGELTEVAGTGTGSGTARAEVRLGIKIGSCIGQGAPAVSHAGLGILAALLAALGVLTVARKSSPGRM